MLEGTAGNSHIVETWWVWYVQLRRIILKNSGAN